MPAKRGNDKRWRGEECNNNNKNELMKIMKIFMVVKTTIYFYKFLKLKMMKEFTQRNSLR